MKDLELAVLGVEEMNENELQSTDGGFAGLAIAVSFWCFAAGACYTLGKD